MLWSLIQRVPCGGAKRKEHRRAPNKLPSTSQTHMDDTTYRILAARYSTRRSWGSQKSVNQGTVICDHRRNTISKMIHVTMVKMYRGSQRQGSAPGVTLRLSRRTWRSKSLNSENTPDGHLLVNHIPGCIGANKKVCRVPNVFPNPRGPSSASNKYLQSMAFLSIGNRHCGTIPRCSRKGKIPSSRNGLLHKVDRSWATNVHIRGTDDQVHVEKYCD